MSGSILNTAGRTIFQLGYQISPIILVGGVASKIGGLLPIVALTESVNFVQGLLQGGVDLNMDDFFAQWEPMPGATLIDNDLGRYPYVNQTAAANAMISNPLQFSMMMSCPMRGTGAAVTKLATIAALQTVLSAHNASGGLYHVVTPSFLFTNCVLRRMLDASSSESKQVQFRWQFDFEKPLLMSAAANSIMNTMMSKLSGGLPTTGALSGIASGSGVAASAQSAVSSFLGISLPTMPSISSITSLLPSL